MSAAIGRSLPRAFRSLLLPWLLAAVAFSQPAVTPPSAPKLTPAPTQIATKDLTVFVNKSVVLENTAGIRRVSVSNGELAEAVAVSETEIIINGKAPGETSLFLWDKQGQRILYDIHILPNASKLERVQEAIAKDLTGQDVSLAFNDGNVYLRGRVNDIVSADRAVAIAATAGKVVNLLNVNIPAADAQILLKVKFANVNRAASNELGANFFSNGALNMPGSISTGQFSGPPNFDFNQVPNRLNLPDILNIFFYRQDLNFGAYLKALETKSLAEVLAEPNLLTLSGHPASFLAGGEFPFPTLQGGGAGVGQITVQFREFGIRLNFEPTVTPRGTIRLSVKPEVSSLDPVNGLTVGGLRIPGLVTRKVQTEVELDNGQSLVIAGLLDNRVAETLSKIPGLANIPLLGKLFQSRAISRNNSELLVVVTPEIVKAIPNGGKIPGIDFPQPFLKQTATIAPQNPTDPKTSLSKPATMPIEQLRQSMSKLSQGNAAPPVSTPDYPGQNNPVPPLGLSPIISPVIAPPATSTTK